VADTPEEEIRAAVELGSEAEQDAPVLQWVDERSGEVRVEYVRSDIFDAVVRAWETGRASGHGADADREGIERAALEGIASVQFGRDALSRDSAVGTDDVRDVRPHARSDDGEGRDPPVWAL
jgi:hypothetical protein